MKTLLKGIWGLLRKPSARWSLGTLLGGGFIVGILFWGGFNWGMELTNREAFCISCHEMKDNVYEEYRGTIHDQNRTGVRATCPDCHVPRDFVYKMKRKIQASNEVLHKILGTINTREKFEGKRLELEKHEWARMKESDSRECRNCHSFDGMDLTRQSPRAAPRHLQAMDEGKTCIDCHKGIAHKLAAGAYQAAAEMDKEWDKTHPKPAKAAPPAPAPAAPVPAAVTAPSAPAAAPAAAKP